MDMKDKKLIGIFFCPGWFSANNNNPVGTPNASSSPVPGEQQKGPDEVLTELKPVAPTFLPTYQYTTSKSPQSPASGLGERTTNSLLINTHLAYVHSVHSVHFVHSSVDALLLFPGLNLLIKFFLHLIIIHICLLINDLPDIFFGFYFRYDSQTLYLAIMV